MQAWVVALVTVVVAVLAPAAQGSMYDDILMEDLLKRLAAYEDPYDPAADWYDESIPLQSRDNGQTSIRDQEYLEHSASHQGGFQYIQGKFPFKRNLDYTNTYTAEENIILCIKYTFLG